MSAYPLQCQEWRKETNAGKISDYEQRNRAHVGPKRRLKRVGVPEVMSLPFHYGLEALNVSRLRHVDENSTNSCVRQFHSGFPYQVRPVRAPCSNCSVPTGTYEYIHMKYVSVWSQNTVDLSYHF